MSKWLNPFHFSRLQYYSTEILVSMTLLSLLALYLVIAVAFITLTIGWVIIRVSLVLILTSYFANVYVYIRSINDTPQN